MSRLITIGLIFISLYASSQGQEPSIPPPSLRGESQNGGDENNPHSSPSSSPAPSSSPSSTPQPSPSLLALRRCRLVVNSAYSEASKSGGFDKAYWDAWFTVSVHPNFPMSCEEIREDFCVGYENGTEAYTWRGTCTHGWHSNNDYKLGTRRSRWKGGLLCAEGESTDDSPVEGWDERRLRNNIQFLGNYLNELGDRYPEYGNLASSSYEVPCSKMDKVITNEAWGWIAICGGVVAFVVVVCIVARCKSKSEEKQRLASQAIARANLPRHGITTRLSPL